MEKKFNSGRYSESNNSDRGERDSSNSRRFNRDDSSAGERRSFGERSDVAAPKEEYAGSAFVKDKRPRTESSFTSRDRNTSSSEPRGYRANDRRENSDRPSFGDRERRPSSFGNREQSGDDRPRRSFNPNFDSENRRRDFNPDRKPFGERTEGGERKPYGDRTERKPFGERRDFNSDRKPFGERTEGGERKPYGDRTERKPFGERRDFNSDRKPFGERTEGGERRPYGDRTERKPFGERRDFNSDRKPFGERTEGGERRPYGDRTERKPFGERRDFNSDRKPFGERTEGGERKPYGDRTERKPFGERRDFNSDRKPFGERTEGGERRPYGDRTERKPFGERRDFNSDRKPFGDRTEGGERKPYGDRTERKPFGERRDFNSDRKPFGDRRSSNPDRRPFADRKGRDADSRPKFDKDNYPKFNDTSDITNMRLNRFISISGVCSRREADELIKEGLITVNGTVVTELGTKINVSDEILYNGIKLSGEKKVYILMNKPKGYVTTVEDPNADKTIMELIEGACTERVYPVGRLDKNSLGVLLITNDGDLTKKLTHPSFEKKKIYHVLLDKNLRLEDMQAISDGIELEDGPVKVDEISYVGETKKEVGVEIHSGRNRVVRRIFEQLGYEVEKLDRVYFAGLTKKSLPRGHWRFLNAKEVSILKSGIFE